MTAEAPAAAVNPQRVLLVTPTRRDAVVTGQLLARTGVACVDCRDLPTLGRELVQGAGAVVLTDAALNDPAVEGVLALLARQPSWSDVPVVLLAREREQSPAAARVLALLTNVIVLERPASIRTMQSAVLTALRGRRRQYELRDQIAQLTRAEQALRDGDRRKDEFLATLAHELRNPLAPLRTGLHALDRLPADSASAQRLREMMERQLKLLVKLIDDLLDVSRIATGKVQLQRERVDMRSVVAVAVEGAQPVIDASRHRLLIELPEAPVWVMGDASRLAQVVGNLVNNAIKYTAEGGEIVLRLARDGPDAWLQVSDNGAGIPRDMLEKVFEMFTQVNRTLDRAQGGLGLGLSLVHNLMALHGGSVSADSAGLERGSTFTIRLPALAAPPEEEANPAPDDTVHGRPDGARLRILVVDDNVDAADSLALVLDTEGHCTRTEYQGEAVLAAAREFAPDVVLCDIGLPGFDGCRVARQLREQPEYARLRMVALTGWGSEEDQRRTRAAGFDAHLTKPVDVQLLMGMLADA